MLAGWSLSVLPAPAQTAQAPAVRAKMPGLPNFATVSAQLFRGAQPDAKGFEELKKLGVDIVVNLRHEPDEITWERGLVQTQGLEYVSIPWRGKNNPDTAQIAQFLQLLRANPDKQVFVHCQRGAERTGVMVACYRMSAESWTADQALKEMDVFGFRGWRFGHLKKAVRDFPSLLANDPVLKTLGIVP
ncbi:MAG TPA: dual specificity protein phosphatase family protein [Vicinamibacterales bacterium]|nr:dual specificity protein phosphatase family protein [Vicinamibacterales bacterium]